jgi:transcriptional regulator with XRE-family HTH domain
MLIGDRLRALRDAKKLSQGDIEERTGLLRSYISRIENGHTIPSVETLEKWARALEVPLYQLFYESEKPSKLAHLSKRKMAEEITWGASRSEIHFWKRLRALLARIKDPDRRGLLYIAKKMARR